ncbi:succinylglutamate desuccinylase/aspartoacylase family protein [Aurantivibrio infirmus]
MIKKIVGNEIKIGEQTIHPGQRVRMELEVAQLYTHTPLSIPVEIVNGKYPGPILLVNAAIHGDELNGVEVVRELLERIKPKTLKGTLIAVPIVNIFGFIHQSRYLPDRRDLNRFFPGTEKGSIAGRIAYQFFNHVVKKCTHVVDLHTGAIHRTNLPQIRANLENETVSEMAQAFGAPVIVDASLREGSLRSEAEKVNIPVITYEAGEALRFDPIAIAGGVRGVLGVMNYLAMIGRTKKKSKSQPVIARSTNWIRSPQDGIVRARVNLGDKVVKDQVLAVIGAPLGTGACEIKAPRGGIVIGQQTIPLVNEGDAVFHLAYFEESDKLVEKQVDAFIDEVLTDDDNVELNAGIGKF